MNVKGSALLLLVLDGFSSSGVRGKMMEDETSLTLNEYSGRVVP